MKAAFAPALAAGLAAFVTSAPAQQAAPPAPSFAPANLSPTGVRGMAANCASCHGTNGHTVAGSPLAPLAGRAKEDLVKAMADFKGGQRPATLMHQVAKGFSDAEIDAIAGYFAAQKR